jgi:hypothetical protein
MSFVDIYAPDATIKSVTARNLISNYNVFPSTINIHDAKYIGLVQGADNNNMLDRSVTKDAIINLYGDITIGTLQWYTDCTLGENANVIIQTKHQPGIRQDGSPYGTSGTWPVRDNRYNGQTIQNLYLGKNSKFTVMAAYMTGSDQTNMLGNIYTAENGQLILTSKGAPGTGGSEAAVLNGNIYIRNGQPIRLGLSSASYPNLSSYCMMYSGDRQFDTVFSPLGSYFTAAETGYSVSTVPNYLVLNNSETNYYEVSVAGGNPATAKYQTLQQVALAINQGSGYAGKIVKIRLLNNRQDEAGWLSVITNCAGIILTGWKDDFGYNIKGDGQQTSGETTSDNDAGDGSAATYKNTNPPGTYGFTTSSDANTTTYMRLNMRVPLTMRNLGLIQAKNTYLNGHGNRIQIGPGLVHKTNGNSFQVFGNEQFDGADDGTSGSTNSFSSANRGADVTIYNGDYTSLCALGPLQCEQLYLEPRQYRHHKYQPENVRRQQADKFRVCCAEQRQRDQSGGRRHHQYSDGKRRCGAHAGAHGRLRFQLPSERGHRGGQRRSSNIQRQLKAQCAHSGKPWQLFHIQRVPGLFQCQRRLPCGQDMDDNGGRADKQL